MAQRHLGTLKVEKVHELDRSALAQRRVVDTLGLVVEFQLYGEDLDTF